MAGGDLIERFESGSISSEEFHHTDHVQLAFTYLTTYPMLQALEKCVGALKRFAAAHGKKQLYNETITCAYFFLIRERMARRERRLGSVRPPESRLAGLEGRSPKPLLSRSHAQIRFRT